MNWYYVAFQALYILLLVLLFVLPFVYCLFKRDFKKGFRFTWITWSIVLFVFGVFIPAVARLKERATGEDSEVSGGAFIAGFMMGWLPGLIFASLGWFLRKVFTSFFKKHDDKSDTLSTLPLLWQKKE